LEEGHLHFFLHGRRMKGEWLMIRLKPRGKEKGENWLLRKIADEHAGGSDDLVATHLTGVESGLTMEEIAAGVKPKAAVKADALAVPASRKTSSSKAASAPKRKAGKAGAALPPPPFQPVQLATLVDSVPAGDRWLHEMKYDGYRTLIAVGGGEGLYALGARLVGQVRRTYRGQC
jgi:bifunctional non-homologous end joining protein LigD